MYQHAGPVERYVSNCLRSRNISLDHVREATTLTMWRNASHWSQKCFSAYWWSWSWCHWKPCLGMWMSIQSSCLRNHHPCPMTSTLWMCTISFAERPFSRLIPLGRRTLWPGYYIGRFWGKFSNRYHGGGRGLRKVYFSCMRNPSKKAPLLLLQLPCRSHHSCSQQCLWPCQHSWGSRSQHVKWCPWLPLAHGHLQFVNYDQLSRLQLSKTYTQLFLPRCILRILFAMCFFPSWSQHQSNKVPREK